MLQTFRINIKYSHTWLNTSDSAVSTFVLELKCTGKRYFSDENSLIHDTKCLKLSYYQRFLKERHKEQTTSHMHLYILNWSTVGTIKHHTVHSGFLSARTVRATFKVLSPDQTVMSEAINCWGQHVSRLQITHVYFVQFLN